MRDMNFFSVYKKRRAKRKGLRIFLIVFIVLLLLINGAIIGGGLWYFNELEKEIENKRAWINDPATVEAIAEANIIRSEADIISDYAELIQNAGDNIMHMKQINSDLLDGIRQLTPTSVYFQSLQVSGRQINIICNADEITGALDMYNALIESENFINVSISPVTVDQESGRVNFNISFAAKEG